MFAWFKGEEKPKIDPTEFHQPDHYHNSEGPMYKVLKDESTEEYETRIYKITNWVSTRMETDYDEAANKGFWKLFGYIGGKNATKSKMAMTCPVRGKVELDGDTNNTKAITMSFFTAPAQLPNPVAANDETIFHEEKPEVKMHVVRFSGFAKPKDWRENLQKLEGALERDGKGHVTGFYYTAGHDPPFRLWGRTNEVMVEASQP